MSDLSNALNSSTAGNISSTMKLEKAYLLIIAPSSPAGGALAASLAGAIAAEGVTSASSALQGASSSGGSGGQAASMGESTLAAGQTVAGGNLGNKITFLFNPLSYTVTKEAVWERPKNVGSSSTAIPIWKGAGPRKMDVEVFLDATYTENGGIQSDIDLLFDCCKPTMLSVMLMKPSPPFVLFGWGLNTGFLSFMSSVVVEYTLFRPDGTPIRAKCSLSMEEIPLAMAKQNPTSGGTARRVRSIVAGDTLQSISYAEYGRPTLWRALAHANNIEDPMKLEPGMSLLIPPLSEATAKS
jgi:nucleoid-associated protein YgaU